MTRQKVVQRLELQSLIQEVTTRAKPNTLLSQLLSELLQLSTENLMYYNLSINNPNRIKYNPNIILKRLNQLTRNYLHTNDNFEAQECNQFFLEFILNSLGIKKEENLEAMQTAVNFHYLTHPVSESLIMQLNQCNYYITLERVKKLPETYRRSSDTQGRADAVKRLHQKALDIEASHYHGSQRAEYELIQTMVEIYNTIPAYGVLNTIFGAGSTLKRELKICLGYYFELDRHSSHFEKRLDESLVIFNRQCHIDSNYTELNESLPILGLA